MAAERIAILAVDDEGDDLRLLGAVLAAAGYAVDLAGSLREARARLAGRPYAVLILDLVLPDGSGLDLLPEARAKDPHAVALVRTGFASTSSAVAALRRGAYDYLIKPSHQEALLGAVARAAERHQLSRALGERTAELESVNRELDARVRGATREIFELNERLNRQVSRLSEANDAQTRFLEDMTHELKNPLAVVAGYADFLSTRPIAGWKPEEAERMISNIRNYAHHLQSLIEELSDSVRIANSTITLRKTAFPAAEAVADAVDGMRIMAAEKGVTLGAASEEGLTVFADRTRVRQILVNLLTNALKFTPSGGGIAVSARADGDRARFCVADSGCGIAPEHAARIFDRFYQVPSEQKHKGLGLGLSIVAGLVALHGGRVWVESEPGQGSRFHFTLPVRKEAPAAASLS